MSALVRHLPSLQHHIAPLPDTTLGYDQLWDWDLNTEMPRRSQRILDTATRLLQSPVSEAISIHTDNETDFSFETQDCLLEDDPPATELIVPSGKFYLVFSLVGNESQKENVTK